MSFRENHLHLSGNMHCVPLIYFVTTRPDDTGEATTGVLYRLRWETLPNYRDRRRPGEHPAPSQLELIEVRGSNP